MSAVVRSKGALLRALLGALSFAAVQTALFANPPAVIVPEDPGWFLNSVQGVAIVAAVFFPLGALSVTLWSVEIPDGAIPVIFGAALVMIATYAWLGLGSLFPIVFVVGAGCIGVPAFAGAWAAFELRAAIKRSRH